MTKSTLVIEVPGDGGEQDRAGAAAAVVGIVEDLAGDAVVEDAIFGTERGGAGPEGGGEAGRRLSVIGFKTDEVNRSISIGEQDGPPSHDGGPDGLRYIRRSLRW